MILLVLSQCKTPIKELDLDNSNQVALEELEVESPPVETSEDAVSGESKPIVLGKQLENPYLVETMQKAYAKIQATGKTTTSPNFQITTTDLYVRFLPKDTAQYDLLQADTTLELFDHPLDFEIEQVGDYYQDPSLPDSGITWQYTVVKPDYVFPENVEYEILAELFLPESAEGEEHDHNEASECNHTSHLRLTGGANLLDALEDEALRLTNNWEEPYYLKNAHCRRRCWTPRGRIRVRGRDGGVNRGWLPVVGVKVRARRWFDYHVGYTNANGFFSLRAFRRGRRANYSISFKNRNAKISSWGGFQTYHNGPKRQGDWNVDFEFGRNSKGWVRATLINAAREYEVQRLRTGIYPPWSDTRPHVNQINIRAIFSRGTGNLFSIRANRIKIWTLFDNGAAKETDDLYAVTFHELGHQSHLKYWGWMFLAKRILRESYAEFIEFYFTRAYYPNHPSVAGRRSIPNQDANRIRASTQSAYTQLFVDLMDNTNQRLTLPGNSRVAGNYADDRVQGYTFFQIQRALTGAKRLEHIRDNLRNMFDNPAERDGSLNAFFNFYLQFQN